MERWMPPQCLGDERVSGGEKPLHRGSYGRSVGVTSRPRAAGRGARAVHGTSSQPAMGRSRIRRKRGPKDRDRGNAWRLLPPKRYRESQSRARRADSSLPCPRVVVSARHLHLPGPLFIFYSLKGEVRPSTRTSSTTPKRDERGQAMTSFADALAAPANARIHSQTTPSCHHDCP